MKQKHQRVAPMTDSAQNHVWIPFDFGCRQVRKCEVVRDRLIGLLVFGDCNLSVEQSAALNESA